MKLRTLKRVYPSLAGDHRVYPSLARETAPSRLRPDRGMYGDPEYRRNRKRSLRRDCYTCQVCGLRDPTGKRLEVDHRIELQDGGSHALENLITLCKSDHQKKTIRVAAQRRRLNRGNEA